MGALGRSVGHENLGGRRRRGAIGKMPEETPKVRRHRIRAVGCAQTERGRQSLSTTMKSAIAEINPATNGLRWSNRRRPT